MSLYQQQPNQSPILDATAMKAVRASLEVVKRLRLTASEAEVDLLMSEISLAQESAKEPFQEIDRINRSDDIDNSVESGEIRMNEHADRPINDQPDVLLFEEVVEQRQVLPHFTTPLKKRKQRYEDMMMLEQQSVLLAQQTQTPTNSSNNDIIVQNDIECIRLSTPSPLSNIDAESSNNHDDILELVDNDTPPPHLENEMEEVSSSKNSTITIISSPIEEINEQKSETITPVHAMTLQKVQPKKRRPRRLRLGSSSDEWVEKIQKKELLPGWFYVITSVVFVKFEQLNGQ